MTKKKSQGKLIIEHLWKHGSITHAEGERLFGIKHMNSIISHLRGAGCEISTERNSNDRNCTVWILNREVENR